MPNTGSWCAAEGEEAGNQTAFAVRLQNKGMDNNTSGGRRRWRGVALAGDADVLEHIGGEPA